MGNWDPNVYAIQSSNFHDKKPMACFTDSTKTNQAKTNKQKYVNLATQLAYGILESKLYITNQERTHSGNIF